MAKEKQVATRVSAEVWEALQIGLLVEGVDTMQELLQPVVEQYAESLLKVDEVRSIQKSANEYRDRQRGVRSLPSNRRRKAKSSSGKKSEDSASG